MEFWKSLYLVMVVIPIAIEAAGWNYDASSVHGPSKWSTDNPKCGGSLQSPIDYVSSAITYDKSLGAITLEGYDALKSGSSLQITNNGHSLNIKVADAGAANISGSGLPGMFTLLGFHFHWGNSTTEGSEHKVGGKAFPAEVHFVHYNMKYLGNVPAAVAAKDGLAVLSVLLEVAGSDNAALSPVLNYAANVTNKDNITTIPNFALRSILPPDISKFYRNNGSLTTPGCDESVTWTVFHNTMTISEKQLNILRGLKMADGMPLVHNFRPIQATNKRTIYATFAAPPTTTVFPTSGTQALGAALVTIILCALASFVLKY